MREQDGVEVGHGALGVAGASSGQSGVQVRLVLDRQVTADRPDDEVDANAGGFLLRLLGSYADLLAARDVCRLILRDILQALRAAKRKAGR